MCIHYAVAFKEAQWQAREERARQHYEKLLEERKRRLEEQRMKEDKRRAAVEEKRRQKLEDDKVTTCLITPVHSDLFNTHTNAWMPAATLLIIFS